MKKLIAVLSLFVSLSLTTSAFASEVAPVNVVDNNSYGITVEAQFDAVNSEISFELPDERTPQSLSDVTNSDDAYVKVTLKANYYFDAYTNRFTWSTIDKVLVNAKSGYSYNNPIYSASFLDGNRTYGIRLSGTLVNTKDGTSKDYPMYVEFYLNPQTGAISTILY